MYTVLKQLWSWWKKFAQAIGRVNSAILLSVLYFTVLGVYAGIVYCRRKFMPRSGAASTFWQAKKFVPPTPERLERQF